MQNQDEMLKQLEKLGGQPKVTDGNIERIGLNRFSDEIFTLLNSLSNINILFFYNVNFKFGDLKRMSQLKGIHTLGFPSCANLTDDDILDLSEMEDLRKLSVLSTKVSKAGAEKLVKLMPKLTVSNIPVNSETGKMIDVTG